MIYLRRIDKNSIELIDTINNDINDVLTKQKIKYVQYIPKNLKGGIE
jgi:hypothetical protein